MNKNFIAKAEATIHASVDAVWDALTNPDTIKKYMFGTTVTSDWEEGSPITWKGEWQGKPYEDKGIILRIRPKTELQYTHFSPLSGVADIQENYHSVTVGLSGNDHETTVKLFQDKNQTEEEQKHSEQNWKMMLEGLKKLLEGEQQQ